MFAFILFAAATAASAPATKPAPNPAPEKLVCRSEAPTGTRFRKRVCMSRAQMEARANGDAAAMKDWVDRAQPNPDENPGWRGPGH